MAQLRDVLQTGWWTSGHGELWNCESTYCMVPLADLPPVTEATPGFDWLRAVPAVGGGGILAGDNVDDDPIEMERVVKRANEIGLTLPEGFPEFFATEELPDQVTSCTDCYWVRTDVFVHLPQFDAWVLRILNDSQSCIMWYLVFEQERCSGVLASPYFYEPNIFEAMEYEEVESYRDLPAKSYLCAETFSEFVYRFWIENRIWYALHHKARMNAVEEAYLKRAVKKLN